MRPLTITFRFVAVFGLLLAILVVFGWQGISNLRGLDAQMQNIVLNRWTEQQLAHQAFQLSAQNSQITQQIYLVDDTNAIAPLLAQRTANLQRIAELIQVIEPRLYTKKEARLFAAVKATQTPYIESYQRALALLMEKKREDAGKIMVNEVRPKLLAYQNAWSAFDQCEADKINQVLEQSKNDFAADQRNLFILLAIAGLMAAGTASFTLRRLKLERSLRRRAEKYLQQSRELESTLVERTLQVARTNETLVETSALLDALLVSTDDDIYFKNLQSHFVYFSLTMLRKFGLSQAAELKGRTDFDFYTEEHARPAFAVEQEINRTGQPVLNLEEKETLLDGRVEWVLTSKMPWRDPAGAIIGTMGISRNITERKQAEEKLHESEARFAGAFEHAPIGMALVSPDGRWLKVNHALCDITGYSEAELHARTYQDITHKDDLEACQENVRQLFAGEIRSCQSEKNYVHRRGHCVPVSFNLSLVRDGQGQPLYLIAQIKDITERRAAETALKEMSQRTERRERMLTTMLSNINDFAYIFDREGHFLFANQPLLNLWGTTLEVAVGKNFSELGYPDDLARKLQSQVQQVFDTRQSLTDETPYASPAGVKGCHEYIFSPAVAADGSVDFVVGSTRDVTARKQAEETLRESEERFSNAFEFAPIGKALVSPDAHLLKVNRALCELLDYPEAELLNRSYYDLMLADDIEESLGDTRQMLAGKLRLSQVERHYRRKGGEIITVLLNVSLIRDARGEPLYFIAQIQDITERQRAVDELRWKTALLEAQVHSSLDGMVVVDSLGKKLLQNQRHVDLWKTPQDIADDKDDSKQLRWNADMTVNPAQFSERVSYLDAHPNEISREEIQLKDGRFLDRYSAPVLGKDGKYYGRIRMVRDITESKRAETELQESKRFLRHALDALSSHIAILDEHGTIIEVNAAWNRVGGNNNHLGINYLKVCDLASDNFSKEAPVVAAGIRAVIAGQRNEFQIEYPCHSPGQKRWFVVRVTPFGGEGPMRVVVAHENITERKLAEAELSWRAAFLESMGNSTIDGILVVDPQGRKIVQNGRFNDLLKIPQSIAEDEDDQKQLRYVSDMVKNPGQFAEKVLYLYSHPEKTSRDEIELKDGTVLDRYSAPVTGKDGTRYGRIWAFRDMTERKKLETQLIQSQKMETVGKLAGGIAHEFNSILTAIMGQSELLLDVLPAGSPLIQSATEIGDAAARAATMTRQLLAYGRKQMLQPVVLDLNRVIVNMGHIVQHLLGADKDVRVISALELHMVKADAAQIEQVIVNLVINARDAMPHGGKLTLETANVTLDQEYVSRFPASEVNAGDYVMLAITDTGAGMSDMVKAHLFEPFFSTKGVGQGTGLGLSTCYGIVKQSGGHIAVYSEVGRGTTFKIYLPQVAPEAKLSVPRLTASNLPQGTETILVVEDDPALRAMAATLLQRLGYIVLTAANGPEALRVQNEHSAGKIDLLFTDVVMPQMSGRELADRVVALCPHTKILFTSAYTENAIFHQGALDKGVALLQKPFTPPALAKKIREVLDQKSAPKTDTSVASAAQNGENAPVYPDVF